MSDQSLHSAKWRPALEQVTASKAVKIRKVYQISIFSESHLAKWHSAALSQVITQTVEAQIAWRYSTHL